MMASEDEIVAKIADEFRCFGKGARPSFNNPLSEALKDRPPQFAMGVDVRTVVQRVLDLHKQRSRRKAA